MNQNGHHENEEDPKTVLQFPSSKHHAEGHIARENAVLEIFTEELHRSGKRAEALGILEGVQEDLDGLLRSAHFRGRLAACIQAYLIEQLPKAVELFGNALTDKQSWAFKLLFELMGLHRVMAGILEPPEEEETGVVISTAFERDYLERALRNLRAHVKEQPAQVPNED